MLLAYCHTSSSNEITGHSPKGLISSRIALSKVKSLIGIKRLFQAYLYCTSSKWHLTTNFSIKISEKRLGQQLGVFCKAIIIVGTASCLVSSTPQQSQPLWNFWSTSQLRSCLTTCDKHGGIKFKFVTINHSSLERKSARTFHIIRESVETCISGFEILTSLKMILI